MKVGKISIGILVMLKPSFTTQIEHCDDNETIVECHLISEV